MKNTIKDVTIILMPLALLAAAAFGIKQAEAAWHGVRATNQEHRFGTCEIRPGSGPLKPDGLNLIHAYNARNLGSPGFRRVRLDLVNDGKVVLTLKVINLWERRQSEVRTLFLLEEPQGLSGTNYLLVERKAQTPEMRIHLFLPAGRRGVIEIEPGNFEQGLLGSDFTYSDLRMQLPERGYRYTLVGETSVLGVPAWMVEAEPSTDSVRQMSPWARTRYYLAKDFQFLLGADYYSYSQGRDGLPRLTKRMRVQSLKKIDGVWTATRLAMHSGGSCTSVLTLDSARFTISKLNSKLFSPDQLPLLGERIRGLR